MKWLKKNGLTLFFVIVLIVGLGIFLYPTISAWYNSFHESRVIEGYNSALGAMKKEDFEKYWEAADKYNDKLAMMSTNFNLSDSDMAEYKKLLDPTNTGVMGYIVIPSINLNCPVYHGTDEATLAVGIGHLAGSSLPTGGENTHTVLSGHRGLPSATLFTNLDRLTIGDTFELHIMDRTITYQVDRILTVLPEETDSLAITQGQEYCTLVTCTPYGINTHRLLVRGHKVENGKTERKYISADAQPVDPVAVAAVIAAIIIVLLVTRQLVVNAIRRRR